MRLKLTLLSVIGNLMGALLTFLYFSFVSVGPDSTLREGPSIHYVIFFVIGTGLIFLVIMVTLNRWSHPLDEFFKSKLSINDISGPSAEQLRRKALQNIPVIAGSSLIAWVMAGFIFGMLQPAILETFFGMPSITLSESLGRIFGITCIGGSFTVLFIYFCGESLWRKELPSFFPEGDMSRVSGAFKLSVRVRLFVVFLMISLLPLTVLSVSAYYKSQALLSADAVMGGHIISELVFQIFFITALGVAMSLVLSLFLSNSVSAPLKEMEKAMKEVEKGNLDVCIRIVSNDEIGGLGEGFARMIKGLKESEAMKESFGKYITQEIRDEILAGRVSLDGEMTRATLLFSDLRDFTPFVESTHPQKVVRIMNQYFSEMAEAIKQNQGLILQYVGDEIEAVFGAPVPRDDHPDLAARAALDMKERLALLNERFQAQGVSPLRHGIGIHTGAVLAGIIGSKERSSYALVGDTVNLASRIQGLTKKFSCDVILSQTTHDLVTGRFQMEQLPAVKVKGKSRDVMVYKLMGRD